MNNQRVGILSRPPRQGSQPSARRQFRPDGAPIQRPTNPNMAMQQQPAQENVQQPVQAPPPPPQFGMGNNAQQFDQYQNMQDRMANGQGDPNRIQQRMDWMQRHDPMMNQYQNMQDKLANGQGDPNKINARMQWLQQRNPSQSQYQQPQGGGGNNSYNQAAGSVQQNFSRNPYDQAYQNASSKFRR